MRRLVTWLLVTLGIAALVRKLRKRDEPEWSSPGPAEATTAPEAAPSPPATPSSPDAPPTDTEPEASEGLAENAGLEGDPAAELRERLARSRADMPSAEESPDDRRAAVHEQGRAALDEMQPSADETEPANEEN
jgi:hypothetical protein